VIEIRDLYKYYDDVRAVGPLSATIESGEIVGLLGLNGAGKTTTLRILACDLLPTSGTVRVDGFDVVDHPRDVRARTGYLPDNPPLYTEMTVTEYLAFAARLRGVSSADLPGHIETALRQARLRKRRDQVVGTLSHGFKQRLGIAQAIVHRPRVVVLDEPITGLDPVQIVEMRKLVRELAGDHTVILSSHNLAEISETCDRLLVIQNGKVGAVGTEAELSEHLLGQVTVTMTVRAGGESDVAALLAAGPQVTRVERVAPAEPGAGIESFAVTASEDVRPTLCRQLVEAGVDIIAVERAARELESVFLKLAGADEDRAEEEAEG
jgi:ABC-2 type transport system ATP-binding protein